MSPEPKQVHASRHDGRTLSFVLSAAGTNRYFSSADINDRVVRQTDESGATSGWQYFSDDGDVLEIYDGKGTLTAVYDQYGKLFSIDNDAGGRPLTITDSVGRGLVLTYTGNRVIGAATPAGTYAFTYDANDNLVSVTYPDGVTRRYHYENTAVTNALTGITDENGVRTATYTFDSLGQAIGETSAEGAGAHQLTYIGNLSTVIDPLGTKRTYTFRTILGVLKLTGVSQPGGSGCGAASSALTYDANGNVATRTDFNGVTTTYQYDLTRNLETARTEAAGTPEARTITTAWHPVWRQPLSTTEPGRLTTWTYNGDGGTLCAPASATIPSVNGGTQPIGVVCAKTITTGNDTRTWRWTYNETGRILTADGPRTDVADITTNTYWPLDATCPGAELGPGRDKGCRGELKQSTNALGHLTRYTRYNAHGQLEESIDPNGLVTTITYDLRQRPLSVSTGGETTTYTYDAAGQLIRTQLPDGNALTTTWDAAHRLIGIADAAGNRIVYTLDAAGNRIGEDRIDPSGALTQSISRSFDALGRLQAATGENPQ